MEIFLRSERDDYVPGSFYLLFFWGGGGGKVKENYWNLLHTYTTQPKKKLREGELYMPDVYKARLYYYLLWIMFTVYNLYMRLFSSSCPLFLRACVRAGLPSISFMLRKIFLYSIFKTLLAALYRLRQHFFHLCLQFFFSPQQITFPRSQRNFPFLDAS